MCAHACCFKLDDCVCSPAGSEFFDVCQDDMDFNVPYRTHRISPVLRYTYVLRSYSMTSRALTRHSYTLGVPLTREFMTCTCNHILLRAINRLTVDSSHSLRWKSFTRMLRVYMVLYHVSSRSHSLQKHLVSLCILVVENPCGARRSNQGPSV